MMNQELLEQNEKAFSGARGSESRIAFQPQKDLRETALYSHVPLVIQVKRTGHEKKPLCSGFRGTTRPPAIDAVEGCLSLQGLERNNTEGSTTHFPKVAGASCKRMDFPEIKTFRKQTREDAEISACLNCQNRKIEKATKRQHKISTVTFPGNHDSSTQRNETVPRKLQPPNSCYRRVRGSSLSHSAAPVSIKPESSVDIMVKCEVQLKKDAPVGNKTKDRKPAEEAMQQLCASRVIMRVPRHEAAAECLQISAINATPPAAPKPQKNRSYWRAARVQTQHQQDYQLGSERSPITVPTCTCARHHCGTPEPEWADFQ